MINILFHYSMRVKIKMNFIILKIIKLNKAYLVDFQKLFKDLIILMLF